MNKALVIFHSQEYGNTELLAKAVFEGLNESGLETTLFNTNSGRFDVNKLSQYDCVAIGSPDYFGYLAGGIKQFVDDLYVAEVRKGIKGLTGKPYVLFFSYNSGNCKALDMRGIFKILGEQVGEPLAFNGMIKSEAYTQCKSLGKTLALAYYDKLVDKLKE